MQRSANNHHRGASESRNRVKFRPQDSRYFSHQDVSGDTAADASQNAQHNRRDWRNSKRKRLQCARHCKERQACPIKNEHRGSQTAGGWVSEEYDQAGEERDRNVPPVAKSRGGNCANQEVARHPAEGRGRQREHEDAKQIKAVPDRRHCAAQGEDKCSSEIKCQQQCLQWSSRLIASSGMTFSWSVGREEGGGFARQLIGFFGNVEHDTRFIGTEKLKSFQLRLEERRRHEVAFATRETTGKQFERTLQKHKPSFRISGADDVAISLFQGAACNNERFISGLSELLPNGFEPRLPIGIVERRAGCHFCNVCLRMKKIAVNKCCAQFLSEQLPDG